VEDTQRTTGDRATGNLRASQWTGRRCRDMTLAFYTVANHQHYLGVLGLINSLRLVGHTDPVIVRDCGLSSSQTSRLQTQAWVVRSECPLPATATKGLLPLACPADVMVILDADVIVTRRLDAEVAAARAGYVVVFPDDTPGRFFEEWAELGLGMPRRQAYASAGHFIVPRVLGSELLETVHRLSATVDVSRTFVGGGRVADPLYYLDQDVMNAVLLTAVPPERVAMQPAGVVAYTPFDDLVVEDEQQLVCRRNDGSTPALLHHVLDKPWLKAMRPNAYSQLLGRLLLGDDVAIPARRSEVPLRLHRSAAGRVDRLRASVQAAVRERTRGRLGLRPRIQAWFAEHQLNRVSRT
jgi:hypothetical protein